MNRATFAVVAGLATALVLPTGFGSHPNPGGDIPGRPEFAADAAACNEERGDRTDVTCTVLYAHVFGLLQGVPINAQFPSVDCADLARGFTTTPTIEPFFDQAQMDLFSTPGFVEYEPGVGECAPRLHPERGLSGDVLLDRPAAGHEHHDGDHHHDEGGHHDAHNVTHNETHPAVVQPVFYWYMSADADDVSVLADPDQLDTGAMPCLTVRVTLQSGRFFGQGFILSVGEATRTVLSSKALAPQATQMPDPCAEGALVPQQLEIAPVHEFAVLMEPPVGDLPKVEGFVVHVEWWQSDHFGESSKVAQREWNVHTGADYRPRLVLPVNNPIAAEPLQVTPHVDNETLIIDASFRSPWGSYDVDIDSIDLAVTGPDGQPFPATLTGPALTYSYDHDGHFEPVLARWSWNHVQDGAPAGTYTLTASAQNWQHSAAASASAPVDV